MRVRRDSLFGSCLLVAAVSIGGCKSDAANSRAPENQPGYEDPLQNTAPRSEAKVPNAEAPRTKPGPVAIPEGPITVRRTHEVGDLYALTMERSDSRLTTRWIATAEILSASPTRIEMGIDVLSVGSEFVGQAPKSSSVNTKVKVTIEGRSHDAQIMSGGSDPLAGDLTALEMIAGDVCQPPPTSHEQTDEWVDHETTHAFAGVASKDGTPFVSYARTQVSERFESHCKATVSLVDGYAGERKETNTIVLGNDLPPSVQTHTLTVRRL